MKALNYAWEIRARDPQLPPPGDWRTWLVLAGRGGGKSRCAGEWVRAEVAARRRGRLAIVAATAADARDVVVEGESGILAISPPGERPRYEPSKRRLSWPNGATATLFSAEEPDRLRGPQFDGAWVDELAAWRYPEAWDMLQLGLRIGRDPRVVVTTTPRPTKIIKALLADESTVVSKWSTFENADNLAPKFLSEIRRLYENTRLGRQEIYAEVLDDHPGALWQHAEIERTRIRSSPELRRIVVAIDPAVSDGPDSDETGIVVAGIGDCSCLGKSEPHGFVLDDLSGKYTPNGWAEAAIGAYRRHQADRIIAESNNGGALVEANLRTVDSGVSYRAVHAATGKRTRAEPVAALYEQGKIHHVGLLPALEDQMTSWDPLEGDRSPDRVDALTWAITELMISGITIEIEEKGTFGRRRC